MGGYPGGRVSGGNYSRGGVGIPGDRYTYPLVLILSGSYQNRYSWQGH